MDLVFFGYCSNYGIIDHNAFFGRKHAVICDRITLEVEACALFLVFREAIRGKMHTIDLITDQVPVFTRFCIHRYVLFSNHLKFT